MATDVVTLEVSRGAALVTLRDPRRRNCLSEEMVVGIADALATAEADASVRAVVLVGEGPAFCAGATPEVLEAAAGGDFRQAEVVYNGFLRVLHSPLLTIAAVNGPAVGAGLNLALGCDLRLAGPGAIFDSRFAKLQLHPGGGHMWLLQRAIGYPNGLMGSLVSTKWVADQALAIGLVSAVAQDVESEALALVESFEDLNPQLARRMVDSYRRSWATRTHDDALAIETEAQRWSMEQEGFARTLNQLRLRTSTTSASYKNQSEPTAAGIAQ